MNKKIKYQVTTWVVLIMIGIALLSLNYILEKRDEVFSSMNLALTEDLEEKESTEEIHKEQETQEEQETTIEEESTTQEEQKVEYEPYLGKIEIEKIGLYKGFYSKESSLNNVKYNLYVMSTSSYPDVDGGNLIIAGHSGNYNNSYFRDLYMLELNDKINIYYNNTKYIYQIIKIYEQDKTGTVNVYRNLSKTTLTLITCTKDDDAHQTIYISELIGKE